MSVPCSCWVGPVSLHSGHCCLRDGYDDALHRVVCGHSAEGSLRWVKNYMASKSADPADPLPSGGIGT